MYGAGAAFFGPKPELIKFGRSRSRLRDLGLPEPPKKWRFRKTAKKGVSATVGVIHLNLVTVQQPWLRGTRPLRGRTIHTSRGEGEVTVRAVLQLPLGSYPRPDLGL